MTRNSLKPRIILTTVVIVTLCSAVFGGVILLIKQRLEEATFGHLVRSQLQTILADPEAEHTLQNPLLKHWHFYRESDRHLPQALTGLSPGTYHSLAIGDTYWHGEVARQGGDTVYLIYDISEWEAQEHALLIILGWGIAAVLLVGIALSHQAARAILMPIRRLTSRVEAIQPGHRQLRIADEFAGSEIGQIARAVDGYLARIDQFIEREQAFSAAASHELRTPLSVIMGAVDILDTNPQGAAASRAVARISRACADMHAFIEATLFLTRENAATISQPAVADVGAVVRELVADNGPRLAQAGIQLTTELADSPTVAQPRSIVQISVGNILRNAIEHSAGRTIHVSLRGRTLTIADSGEGIAPEHIGQVFDASFTTKPGGTGLGLNLVRRVCDRFHWQLTLDSERGRGTRVAITFP